MSFDSLKKQTDDGLSGELLALQAVTFSQIREDAPSELQKAADYLETLRSSKPPEIRPVLDLQVATDYVEMARLERKAGNEAAADRHEEMAERIVHSLGWQDVSSEKLAKLTHKQLWWETMR